ncbi:3'-5' exonuclease [Gorillibacterium massiliense]|uniref:3'-5' exonuclease n=1 Tax=Gorillibacterium massiliense TaxID=1280390 RepID=UPI0004B41F5C|nr:3'-5' exonuclease [Gorillibacterium massiliense]
MVHIIYDLEMTVCRKKTHISETIEIGAVKVLEQNGKMEIIDTFQSFIRPKLQVLSRATVEFTGITQADVDGAEAFDKVMERFLQWIGETEDYYLCSWGPDDKLQLTRDCRAHQMTMEWIRNHNNLQKHLNKLRKQEKHQQMGLKAALDWLEIPFSGSQHRALDDALNTAKIFLRLADDMELEKNEFDSETGEGEEVVYKTGSFSNNPFEKLAGMMGNEPFAG